MEFDRFQFDGIKNPKRKFCIIETDSLPQHISQHCPRGIIDRHGERAKGIRAYQGVGFPDGGVVIGRTEEVVMRKIYFMQKEFEALAGVKEGSYQPKTYRKIRAKTKTPWLICFGAIPDTQIDAEPISMSNTRSTLKHEGK
jgi:hypothetical protein